MDDLRTSMLARIDRGLDAMAKAPRMFGSPESLESQALLLLELKCMVLRPHFTTTNPGELEETYERFIGGAFADAPATMLSYILNGQGKQSELPEYIQRFRREVERELPEEDPYEHNDLVLDVIIRSDVAAPPFSKVCAYYERFLRALRSIARHTGPRDRASTEVFREATDYPVPDIMILQRPDHGTLIRIPLTHSGLGQIDFDRQLVSEQRVQDVIKQAMNVVEWADEDHPEIDNLRVLFPGDKKRKDVAAQTIHMLPEQGIDSVRVGGRLLQGKPVVLRPSHGPRIAPVVIEGEVPEVVSYTGIVRAVDLDGMWFRVKHGSWTKKCWATDRPEVLDAAKKALASDTKIRVTGNAFKRAFFVSQPLVLMAA